MAVCTYKKNQISAVTEEFEQGSLYGKVKLGLDHIFWKKAFSWKYVSMAEIHRVYRRVEAVDTKMCCGKVNFDIQKLILELKDGTSCELLIGEGTPKEAEALWSVFKEQRPEILFGKFDNVV